MELIDKIPRLHFDTRKLPPGAGLSVIQASIPHYEIEAAAGTTPEAFVGHAEGWFLGDMILVKSAFSAVKVARMPAQILTDGIDTCNFTVLSRGSWIGRFDDREVTVGSGQLASVDLGRPFEVEAEAFEAVHLIIGRTTLRNAVRGDFNIAGHVFDGTAGTLLMDAVLSLARHIDGLGLADTGPVQKALIAQSAAAIAQIPPQKSLHVGVQDLRTTVQRYIDRNLTDRDLSPETIVDQLTISRSVLYRNFEAYGGISSYIQRRRLQAVHALLLHPEEERSIGELAETFGFSRASHFTTAFQRTFGCTPRILRSTRRQRLRVPATTDAAELPDVARSWIREIILR